MTIGRSSARQLRQTIQATTLSKWIFATAIIGTGLVYLTVASHERGAAPPIEQLRSAPLVKTIVPASVESAHLAAASSNARQPQPTLSEAKFRFGFLEFEDDADAPSR